MAPRKNRPVLYEVVARSQRRGRSALQRPTTPPAPPAKPTAVVPSTPLLAPSAPADVQARVPTLRIADGRVYLALGWPQLTVIAAFVLVLLVAAFQAGKGRSQPPAPKPATLEGVLSGAPEPESLTPQPIPPTPSPRRAVGPVATPLGEGQSADETPVAKPPARSPPPRTPPPANATPAKDKEPTEAFSFAANSYYVVVQHFRTRDREKADAAREFLRSKGVKCVVRAGGGDLQLVATEAFASEQQAQGLVRRILELGKEYWNSGGGYEFTGAKARKF